MTDGTEVHARIQAASKVFAALKDNIFATRDVRFQVKAKVYKALVLPVLLYCAETWTITAKMRKMLNAWHHKNVRIMCRVTMWQVRLHHITMESLLRDMGLRSIEQYIMTRSLRWAGHVARMPVTRLPRQFLTSWVQNSRPVGRPYKTYGHTLQDHLRMAGLPTEFEQWHELAQDRGKWRTLIGAKPDRVGIRMTAVPHTHNQCNVTASQGGRALRPRPWIQGRNLRTIT